MADKTNAIGQLDPQHRTQSIICCHVCDSNVEPKHIRRGKHKHVARIRKKTVEEGWEGGREGGRGEREGGGRKADGKD